MAPTTLDVSVVICAYTEKRWDDLVAAVASVQRQTALPREIIVVIDHNPDLLERVRNHMPGVIAIENGESPGASGSRNSGVTIAQGALIAFLDDDAEAMPDWLERLQACYADARVLGAGGAIEPRWLSGRPRWFPDEFNWVVGCTYRGMPATTAPVRNLIAANMSIRREVFVAVGGFLRGFGKVGTCSRPEETELCIRALQRWPEAVWLYAPPALVYHRVPAHRACWRYFMTRCYHEGLGKAALVGFLGVGDGLASERAYTFRTLPTGVIRGLADTILRRDVGGMTRATAIVAGLTMTAAGYLMGRASAGAAHSTELDNQERPLGWSVA